MSWYDCIATFLNYSLPQVQATRRTNLALLTVAYSGASCPGYIGVGTGLAGPVALFPPSA